MRRTRRRIGGRVALVLALFAVLALVWQGRGLIILDPDQRAISFERWKRWTVYSSGAPLPGTPELDRLESRLATAGLVLGAPVFMRIFKREFELELWIQRDGRFQLFTTYPICRWSGRLGPKLKQGDRQAPEGFYTVDASQLNPRSRWHRSFNLGFPNAFDRWHRRTGTFLMVHGGCSSVGCFAMTNAVVDEIWRLVTAAFDKGQQRFQVQVFPFRMTEENLEARRSSRDSEFWRDLKLGHDLFESTRRPPRVSVCQGRYTFDHGPASGNDSSSVAVRCPRAGA